MLKTHTKGFLIKAVKTYFGYLTISYFCKAEILPTGNNQCFSFK